MKKISLLIGSFAFLLSGCGSVKITDYKDKEPKLDIRQYLNGKIEAKGILYDITGKADRQFYIIMDASWKGNVGTLAEDFTFNDGKKEQRTWTIKFIDDHNFTATAGDVIGEAKGVQYGNVAQMSYVLDAKRSNGKTIKLSMDDWLYLLDKETLINRTKMKKFGLTVGELVISFRKL